MEDPEKCFSCKHFRFQKPKPEFCTIKKKQIDPLSGNHKCYVLRKDFFNRVKSSENRIKELIKDPKFLEKYNRRFLKLKK